MIMTDKFCWCGLPLYKIGDKELCQKHLDKPKPDRNKISKYSGKSNSVNKFNNYS